jgi:hypothetical protein
LYLTHLRKYHGKERLFSASLRSEAQWNITQALYDQDQAVAPIQEPKHDGRLLEHAAQLIREWVSPDEETSAFLKKQNDLDLVLLLTGNGPRYVLKQQTANAKRLNKTLYYDSQAASLLFGLAIKHKGKVQGTFHELGTWFTASGCPCAFLGLRRQHTQNLLLDEILRLPDVESLRLRLIAEATDHGEWEIVSHDATFKSLFSIIGQIKMAQRADEAHALHGFLGKSGALPGLSIQPKESAACFKDWVPEGSLAENCWFHEHAL